MTNTTATPSAPAKGSWNEQKSKLKAKFPTLMDADLRYEEVRKEEMFTKLESKLGKTREDLQEVMVGL